MPLSQALIIKRKYQTGQSMTQYLILMFVMTLGSLTAFWSAWSKRPTSSSDCRGGNCG